MLTRTWTRWVLMHGLLRAFARWSARRGEPLGNLALGPDGLLGSSPYIEEIRRRGPIPRMSGVHITADYEVCRTILRDRSFGVVSPNHPGLPRPVRWLLAKTDPGLPNLGEPPSMLVTDPPDHTRYRRIVGQAFGPKAIAALERRIAEVANDLIDGLEAQPRPDLIGDFSARMPVTIIAEMLGLPADMHSTLLKWGDSGAPLLERGVAWTTYRAAVDDLVEVKHYFDRQFDGLDDQPRDDVLGMLAADDALTRREQVANAALLLDAGFLTTVNMLGNGIALLASHPDQLELLTAEPWRWRNAVEEILRYDGPVRMTGRVANHDVDIDHQRIPAGSLVLLSLAGANHDPGVFPDPQRFDVTRDNAAEHLAFGSGIHGCLGSRLARLEGSIALPALFDRYPNLRLDGPPIPHPLRNLHAYRSMPVELGARATPR
ncbi:cytochrome P450 [Nocardia sp. NPDC004582]